MMYEIHIKRWITNKREKLEGVIKEMEADILSTTEEIQKDKLNELSLNW